MHQSCLGSRCGPATSWVPAPGQHRRQSEGESTPKRCMKTQRGESVLMHQARAFAPEQSSSIRVAFLLTGHFNYVVLTSVLFCRGLKPAKVGAPGQARRHGEKGRSLRKRKERKPVPESAGSTAARVTVWKGEHPRPVHEPPEPKEPPQAGTTIDRGNSHLSK